MYGHLETLELMLAAGANPNCANFQGFLKSVIHSVVSMTAICCLQMILRYIELSIKIILK
jgi:hypothetical protein